MTAITLVGWETGDIQEGGATISTSTNSGSSLGTATVSTVAPRTGAYSLVLSRANNLGITVSTIRCSIPLGGSKTEIYERFGFRVGLTTAGIFPLVFHEFFDSNSAVACDLRYNTITGLIEARRGTNQLAVSITGFPTGEYHVIETHYIPHNTTGVITMWVDGVQWFTFSGNTRNGSVNNVATTSLSYNYNGNGSTSADVPGGPIYFDDFGANDTAGAVNNAQVGQGGVLFLKPNGVGTTTQWARGGTDTGQNWSQVNEVPPNDDVTYNFDSVLNERDLYTLEDAPTIVVSVRAAQEVLVGRNTDASGAQVAMTNKSGATTTEESAFALSQVYAIHHGVVMETDPNTVSLPWTKTSLDALEAGVTVK